MSKLARRIKQEIKISLKIKTPAIFKCAGVLFWYFEVGLTNRAGLSSNDFERILLDDSAAPVANIQSVPTGGGFDYIADCIARIKTVGMRFVAAKTNPRVTFAGFE